MQPARTRVARRAVHGVLLLDKPVGLSSNDALQRAKRLFRAEKAGHTGTLDPLATGLLPLCFGAATKFSQASLDADKAYRAVLTLGVTTSTADLEGEVLARQPVSLTRERIDAACARFVGEIDQRPPMHSALKHEGRALYDYARAGLEVERAPRRIRVHRFEVVAWHGDRLTLDVRCSKGTYVRTLAQELGEALGCGAHLAALRRTASGTLDIADAHTLDGLEALDEAGRDALLLPPDTLLGDCPEVNLGDADAGRFLTGLRRRVDAADQPQVRVYGPPPGSPAASGAAGARRAFLGSAHVHAGELIPTRLLSPPEVQGVLAAAAPHPLHCTDAS